MKKIVLGIVVMAVLFGGLGAGFVAGYEYKCMEEEQLFDELFMEMDEEWGCSCYYTGDMRKGFECIGDCVENDLIAHIEEIHEKQLRSAYEEGYNYSYWDSEPDDEGLEWICGVYEWMQEYKDYDFIQDILDDYDEEILQQCEDYWARHSEVLEDVASI